MRFVTQHVFICGAKSIGQYGGYETFVEKLLEQHEGLDGIEYHVACKHNGEGYMDERRLSGVSETVLDEAGEVTEFRYRGAHVFKLKVPNIGPAVAVWYDAHAVRYALRYCREHNIEAPIFYILTCRIGPVIGRYKRELEAMGGKLFLNPDGHEWKRAKWSAPIRRYWKLSEGLMVKHSDLVICDSENIRRYIREEYKAFDPETAFIAYGSDLTPSALPDDDPSFRGWLEEKGLQPEKYYLIVGRFVLENNYETVIREFMASDTDKTLAIITNSNEKLMRSLEERLHFKKDPRIRFVGTVYDQALLKKIRENAWGYFHGHEVGGTNPSLLEALGSTKVNLALDVGFNREVAEDGALYWTKQPGNLRQVIEQAEQLSEQARSALGEKARERIRTAYSWERIGDQYAAVFLRTPALALHGESGGDR